MKGFAVTKSGTTNRNERFSFFGYFLAMLALLGGIVATQQYYASALGYHSALGSYLLKLGSIKIYYPFQCIIWSFDFGGQGGRVGYYTTILNIGFLVSLFLFIAVLYFFYYKRSLRKEEVSNLHGSAKFADLEEIRKMGLLPAEGKERKNKGAIIGAYKMPDGTFEFLRFNEPAHISVAARTRGGKGVTIIIPTLLTLPSSVFVHDLKGENWELTAGCRHMAGSLCMRLAPTYLSGESIDGVTREANVTRLNILQEIRLFSDYDVLDAQNIAAQIADPDSKGMDDHWISTSFGLLVGVFLHVMYCESGKSLTGAAAFLSDPAFTDVEQRFNHMLSAEHDPEGRMGWKNTAGEITKTHPVVAAVAAANLSREERERNSVLSTAMTKLNLYLEPIVSKNTERSDFKISDMMNHTKPVSLYAVIPASDKERLRPFTRIFVGYQVQSNMRSMSFLDGGSSPEYQYKLLMLLDEFPALRKLDIVQDALKFAAGFGIQFMFIVQDLAQLTDEKDGYGRNQQITAGCQVQVYFTPNTLESAETISKMTGDTTVRHQETEYSGKRIGVMMDNMNVRNQLHKRALMNPDEVRRMPDDESLIFMTGQNAIRANKLPYYRVPFLQKRAEIPPPSRVGCAWKESAKKGASYVENWLMVSVLREGDGLYAYINVYDDYPEVAPRLKQRVIGTDELLDFPVTLADEKGVPHTGILPLEVKVLRYKLAYEAPAGFSADECFELHLPLKNKVDKPDFEQTGFFRALAVCERRARDTVRELARANELDARFIPVMPRMNCLGTVFVVTDKCAVVQREQDEESFYVFRRELLDVVPEVGKQVSIAVRDNRGRVTVR